MSELLAEIEVPRGLLLEPEPVVLGRVLQELGRLLEDVLVARLLGLVARLRLLGGLFEGLGLLEGLRRGDRTASDGLDIGQSACVLRH